MRSLDVRYQVFVSSTYRDLREERQQVIQALLELDCIPAGMELFPAADDDQWTLIKRVIDDSDYYVLIIGGRYGSTTSEGISYTEREFDYALANAKPIMAFLHSKPDELGSKVEVDREARERLAAFREKVETGRTCRYWSTAGELGGFVSRAIARAKTDHPAEGWVRGRFAAGPELLAQLNDLRDQNQRLNADIASLKLSAPEDAKEYEGGSDTVAIYGSYGIRAFGQAAGAWQVNATWDEVFSVLGPFMFDECDEGLMTKTLEDSLSWKDDNTAQMHVHLANDVLQTVKIQLLALGLIQKSVKKRALNNTASYWKLTPYGETYLLKLRAIRKEITS